MKNKSPQSDLRTLGLIAVPAVITLIVTLLRLTGELRHWSARWFSTDTGGPVPQGVSWLVGITWLAAPFGIYFAWRLAQAKNGPRSYGRALLFALLGLVVYLGYRYVLILIPIGFPHVLILIWLFWSIAAALQFLGWPALARTLLVYGLSARLPVAVIMFLAMLGSWGTHYDYVGIQWPPHFTSALIPRYLWLAFFPQLVAWVAYTIALGSLAGVIVTAIIRPKSGENSVSSNLPYEARVSK